MVSLAGFSHVALTVSDMPTARRFYEDTLAMPVLDSSPTYCALTTGSEHLTALVLTTHEEQHDGPFSEFRLGLDHVSFTAADLAELEAWQRRLDEHGVAFDRRRSEWGHHLNFRDPDNIAIEIVVLEPDEHIRSLLAR